MTDSTVSHATILSRKDWAGTQPTAPTYADRKASDTVVQWITDSDTMKYDYTIDSRLGNVPGSLVYEEDMPITGANNGLTLVDLRGKSYYDPEWDLLLDQLDFSDPEEIRLCLFEAGYTTGPLESIGKDKSLERDGPLGLTHMDSSGKMSIDGACAYPSVTVMAATWNKELMYEFGYMVGQEALVMDINGWYAPGLNTHRSPFGGRNAEYFSEDGLLAGNLAAKIISGSGDAGIYCSVKHLALNDSENNRDPHSSNWATEQAIREIYLKPFEIALNKSVKTIKFIADENGTIKTKTMRAGDYIMVGNCGIGTYWNAVNYDLLTDVIRGEWGFQGYIVTDMNSDSNSNRIDMMLRSGCDSLMSLNTGLGANSQDYTSATGISVMRTAIKDLCYTLSNSNFEQGLAPGATVSYGMSPWAIYLLVSDIIVGLLIVAAILSIILRKHDHKKNPEKYRA